MIKTHNPPVVAQEMTGPKDEDLIVQMIEYRIYSRRQKRIDEQVAMIAAQQANLAVGMMFLIESVATVHHVNQRNKIKAKVHARLTLSRCHDIRGDTEAQKRQVRFQRAVVRSSPTKNPRSLIPSVARSKIVNTAPAIKRHLELPYRKNLHRQANMPSLVCHFHHRPLHLKIPVQIRTTRRGNESQRASRQSQSSSNVHLQNR